MGGKPNAARDLTKEEETRVMTLQRSLWWLIVINCGFHGNDESTKLCWGDLVLVENKNEPTHLVSSG